MIIGGASAAAFFEKQWLWIAVAGAIVLVFGVVNIIRSRKNKTCCAGPDEEAAPKAS